MSVALDDPTLAQALLLELPRLAHDDPDWALPCFLAGQLHGRLLTQQTVTLRQHTVIGELLANVRARLSEPLAVVLATDLRLATSAEAQDRIRNAIRYLALRDAVEA